MTGSYLSEDTNISFGKNMVHLFTICICFLAPGHLLAIVELQINSQYQYI